jgi:hypothetical protein
MSNAPLRERKGRVDEQENKKGLSRPSLTRSLALLPSDDDSRVSKKTGKDTLEKYDVGELGYGEKFARGQEANAEAKRVAPCIKCCINLIYR